MREVDFTEKSLSSQWHLVNGFWKDFERQTLGLVKRSLEQVLQVAVSRRIGGARYERVADRRDYRNGSYGRELLTSYGWIRDLRVPRVRRGGVETVVLERYRRRQRQVDQVLLEAFLLGHSTRKTGRLFRRLFGGSVSAMTISNIVRTLQDQAVAFHRRALRDDYRLVYLDGLWVTLSKPVKTKKVVLVAMGVGWDGREELLDFQVTVGESESCWWGFLSDLKQRGVRTIELIISDGSAGLLKAMQGLYPRVTHQQCVFHKVMALEDHLVDSRHRRRIIADAFHVFATATETDARTRLRDFTVHWSDREPKAVRRLLKGIDACLIYLRYPEPLRTAVKTNNPLERYLEEIRRRIIPMRSFNNVPSVERIIYGIIAHVLNNQLDIPELEFTQVA